MTDYKRLLAGKAWPPIPTLAIAWMICNRQQEEAKTEEERERLEDDKSKMLYKLNHRPGTNEELKAGRQKFLNIVNTPSYAENMSNIAASYIARADMFLVSKTDALNAALIAERITATIDGATNSKPQWTEYIKGKFVFTPDNGGEPTDLSFNQIRPIYSMLTHPKEIEKAEEERAEIMENLLLSRRLDAALDELAKIYKVKAYFEKHKSDFEDTDELIKKFNAASAETFRMIYNILPDTAFNAFIGGYLPIVIKTQKIAPEAKKVLRERFTEGAIESSRWLALAAMTEQGQPVGDWDGKATADGVLTLFSYARPSEFKYWAEQFEDEKEFSEFADKVFRAAEKTMPEYEHTDRELIRQHMEEAAAKLKARFIAAKG